MGIQISEIIPRKEISINELKGKTIAIDAFNILYQFLTSIRQKDGTPLMNKKGKITSHLSGLFYRNINFLKEGIRPVYVFDGKPPELKEEEIKRRYKSKIIAKKRYKSAEFLGDEKSMKKYSGQFVRITDKIVQESKDLLNAMGIPVIQASGEGEAEAATLGKMNKVWATASQDYDSLLYGTPYLIRNLTLAKTRKSSTGINIDVNLELIEFQQVLNKLQIDKDQLICLAILIGTDYNIGGVSGLGQKKALEIVQRYKYPIEIFNYLEKSGRYNINFDWKEIFRQFHEYSSSTSEDIEFKKTNEKKVKEILLSHDFSESRIDSGLEKLKNLEEKKKQKGLRDFF
tara:strand:- start:2002 stop:3033 length:1032 start_codon:yes stop_codon:yes gene_type:complete